MKTILALTLVAVVSSNFPAGNSGIPPGQGFQLGQRGFNGFKSSSIGNVGDEHVREFGNVDRTAVATEIVEFPTGLGNGRKARQGRRQHRPRIQVPGEVPINGRGRRGGRKSRRRQRKSGFGRKRSFGSTQGLDADGIGGSIRSRFL